MTQDTSQKTNWAHFAPLISVFFFWGFVAASNDILIPVFKKAFELSQSESQLVSLAFYVAYTVGAIFYMIISAIIKKDIVNRLGYKNALAVGLGISAVGSLFFYPAATLLSFPLMLSGLFIVGLGFSLQQTVANPLAIIMGSPSTGSQRLTMAGGINNLGTTIGPVIVGYVLFGANSNSETVADIDSVKMPYLILGAAFLVVAFLLKKSTIPNHTPVEAEVDPNKKRKNFDFSALKYPQLLLGMVAIFVYVGVEVSTPSNLPTFLEEFAGFETNQMTPYISLYWASMMIGRWGGAVEALGFSKKLTPLLKILAPYLAFAVFLLVNVIGNHDVEKYYIYAVVILVLILADLLSKGNPAKMLLYFSSIGIVALLVGMNSSGLVSVYAFISVGLFCSTLWPCIFALAIKGLGKDTNQGSNFLIMMIMGGGVISYLQGLLADAVNIRFSYWVGVICFAYLIFYAWIVPVFYKKQNISNDSLQKSEAN